MLKPFATACALTLCLPAGTARGDSFEMESLSWLAGCWARVDGETGSGEFWTLT